MGARIHHSRLLPGQNDSVKQKGRILMPRAVTRSHKYFWLDPAKIKRAQEALGARTQTETIDRALDLVIAEAQSHRLDLTPCLSSNPRADSESRAR
jgi:hypothetical protein